MVRPAGRGGNEMGFTTEFIFGACNPPYNQLSHYYYQFQCSFFAKVHHFHQFNSVDPVTAKLFELSNFLQI